MTSLEYLELLARNAAAVEFEGPILAARAAGADAEAIAELEHARGVALQIRGVLEARRRRESELSALFETANDLAALSDVDAVLEAIVRRARLLLQSDIAYLTLNDDDHGDTYMRVTDGSISPAFRRVRLPMGAGLGGLVAQTATPYSSATYFEDERFRHTSGIDSAVRDEGLVSILGVPLVLGPRVIGVLYAANRTEKPFSRDDVALLASLAAHAAIAIDNARLLGETRSALSELEAASDLLQARTAAVERAADAHDRLAGLVLHGGGVEDVAREVREVLGGELLVLAGDGSTLACTGGDHDRTPEESAAVERAVSLSRTLDATGHSVVPVVAGTAQLGVLLLRREQPLDEADRRILERAALVTALLLLFQRSVAEAESRVRGDLLRDLLSGADRDPANLRERARFLGADLDQPHAVVVADCDGDRDRAAQAAAHMAAGCHGFSTVHQSRVVLILPGLAPGEAAREVTDRLTHAVGSAPTTGAAGPATGVPAIVDAHAEASRVLEGLRALGRDGEAAESGELGFVGLLLGDRRDVSPFVESVLGPVLEYDEQRGTSLVDTLEAYFRNGRNLARTRAELHVHVNTVTQRLDRVGRLLGEGWQEPESQLEMQLALRLNRLRGRTG